MEAKDLIPIESSLVEGGKGKGGASRTLGSYVNKDRMEGIEKSCRKSYGEFSIRRITLKTEIDSEYEIHR
jgi:hypothetical protein